MKSNHLRFLFISVCSALCFSGAAAAPSDHQRAVGLASSLSSTAMRAGLHELQEIADASGGNRDASSPGYPASAEYIESQLLGKGLRVWREAFDYPWQESLAQLRLGKGEYPLPEVMQLGTSTTPAGGVAGDIVLPMDQAGCTADAWAGVDIAGKVALIRSQLTVVCTIAHQIKTAQQLGAAALLLYSGQSIGMDTGAFPVLFINDEAAGESLRTFVAGHGPLRARIDTSYREEIRSSFNLFAETRGVGPVIMIGAHLDSVPAGSGMDDNASGTVAVMEIARKAADAGLPGRLRFAWWGAEEYGLVGSTRYLQALSSSDPSSLRDIRAYLNADMIGSPNYVLAIYSPEMEGPAPQLRAIHRTLADYFSAARTPFITMDKVEDGVSDHMPFRNCGLAYGGVSSFVPGTRRNKTLEEQRLFGGKAGAPFSPHYHKASDRLENIAMPAVDALSRALAYSLARLAQRPPVAVGSPACDTVKLNNRVGAFRAHHH